MMKKMLASSLCAATALTLTGCLNTPLPQYTINVRDKPSAEDVRRTDASRGCIAETIWISTNHVQLTPAPGFTTVTIPADSLGGMENALLWDLEGFNANHPINPIHLQVK